MHMEDKKKISEEYKIISSHTIASEVSIFAILQLP
jgi:hypothetical protein